jgi:hypothetical protein
MGLVSNLSWPVVVLVIFFALRGPIAALIPTLRGVRGPGGWALDFREKAADAERMSEVLIGADQSEEESVAPGVPTNTTWVDDLLDLAEVSPQAAVLEAFLRVEHEIMRLAVPYGRPTSARNAARALAKADVIPADALTIIDFLATLRNAAVHSSNPTVDPQGAKAYVDASVNVIRLLETIPPPQTSATS